MSNPYTPLEAERPALVRLEHPAAGPSPSDTRERLDVARRAVVRLSCRRADALAIVRRALAAADLGDQAAAVLREVEAALRGEDGRPA